MATVAEQLANGTMRTNYDITPKMAADLQAASDAATARNNAGYASMNNGYVAGSGPIRREGGSSYVAPTTASASVVPATTATVATPTATTSTADTAAQIKAAQDAAALKTTYDNQLQATINPYKTAQANIPTQTTALNNQASSQGMVNAQHIRNALAQMGLLQSGESASQQLANDTSTANNINANNLAGQQLDASYNDKIAAATAQNALDYNNAVTHASEFAQQMGLSQAQLANTIAQQGIDNAYRDKAFAQAANQFAQQMGLSQAQYASGLSQWAQTFAETQKNSDITNAINSVPVTGRIPDIIKSSFPSSPVANTTTGSSSTAGTSLPSYVAAQYPGATNVIQVGTGYKFNSNTGSPVYWVPPLS